MEKELENVSLICGICNKAIEEINFRKHLKQDHPNVNENQDRPATSTNFPSIAHRSESPILQIPSVPLRSDDKFSSEVPDLECTNIRFPTVQLSETSQDAQISSVVTEEVKNLNLPPVPQRLTNENDKNLGEVTEGITIQLPSVPQGSSSPYEERSGVAEPGTLRYIAETGKVYTASNYEEYKKDMERLLLERWEREEDEWFMEKNPDLFAPDDKQSKVQSEDSSNLNPPEDHSQENNSLEECDVESPASAKTKVAEKGSVGKIKLGCGLVNVGLTCYLNSSVQAIANVAKLRQYVKVNTKCQKENSCSCCTLNNEIEQMSLKRTKHKPEGLLQHRTVFGQDFREGQHDSHEYYTKLWDRVVFDKSAFHECDGSSMGIPTGAVVQKTMNCTECEHSHSNQLRVQRHELTLPVVCGSIQSGIDDEMLGVDKPDEYKCDNCTQKGVSLQVMNIEAPSSVFTVVLNRFDEKQQKDSTAVNIDHKISIPLNSSEKKDYKLVAVILHLGKTSNSGHYYTATLEDDNYWTIYDDQLVHRNIKQIPNLKSLAYMLFYEEENSNLTDQESDPISQEAPEHEENIGLSSNDKIIDTDEDENVFEKTIDLQSEEEEELSVAEVFQSRDTVYDAAEVRKIFGDIQEGKYDDKLILDPPYGIVGGNSYLYNTSSKTDKDYLKDQFFGFTNDGNKKFKVVNLTKSYFRLLEPGKNAKSRMFIKGFEKHCWRNTKCPEGEKDVVLIHYIGNEKLYDPRKHGNSLKDKKFVSNTRKAKDIIVEKLKSITKPTKAYNAQINEMALKYQEKFKGLGPVVSARNTKQVENLQYKERLKSRILPCEVFSIVEMAVQDFGPIIHDIRFFPTEIYIFGDQSAINFAKTLLEINHKESNHPQAIYYDTTFNLTDSYMSALVMKNTFVEGNPIFPVILMLHSRKTLKAHRALFEVADELLNMHKYESSLPILTDREPSIRQACQKIFPNHHRLCCHNHIIRDIEFWTKKHGGNIPNDVGGYKAHVEKLLEADTLQGFKEKYADYSITWDPTYLEYFETSMLQDVQDSAKFNYMKFPAFEEHKPTINPSESFNAMVKREVEYSELPKDTLLLTLHGLQLRKLKGFKSASGPTGNFINKTGMENYTNHIKLPEYKDLSLQNFVTLFKKNVTEDTENQLPKDKQRLTQRTLAKLVLDNGLIHSHGPTLSYLIQSPYGPNVSTVKHDKKTKKMLCSCSSTSNRCYHIMAVLIFEGQEDEIFESRKQFRLGNLTKNIGRKHGPSGRKKPMLGDDDFIVHPAPQSLAATALNEDWTNLDEVLDDIPIDNVTETQPKSQGTPKPATKLPASSPKDNTQDPPSTPTLIPGTPIRGIPPTPMRIPRTPIRGIPGTPSRTPRKRVRIESPLPSPVEIVQSKKRQKTSTICNLDSLKAGNSLSSFVVNHALCLFVKEKALEQSVLIVPPDIYEAAAKNNFDQVFKFVNDYNAIESDILLLPIPITSEGSPKKLWILGGILLNKRTIFIIDSMKDNSSRPEIFANLTKVGITAFKSSKIARTEKDWKLIYNKDCHQDKNIKETGVSVCINAAALLKKQSLSALPKQSSAQKRKMIKDLLMQKDKALHEKITNGMDIYEMNLHSLLDSALLQEIQSALQLVTESTLPRILHSNADEAFKLQLESLEQNWSKCSAVMCKKSNENEDKQQHFCIDCRKWFHENCAELLPRPGVNTTGLFCPSCYNACSQDKVQVEDEADKEVSVDPKGTQDEVQLENEADKEVSVDPTDTQEDVELENIADEEAPTDEQDEVQLENIADADEEVLIDPKDGGLLGLPAIALEKLQGDVKSRCIRTSLISETEVRTILSSVEPLLVHMTQNNEHETRKLIQGIPGCEWTISSDTRRFIHNEAPDLVPNYAQALLGIDDIITRARFGNWIFTNAIPFFLHMRVNDVTEEETSNDLRIMDKLGREAMGLIIGQLGQSLSNLQSLPE